MKIWETLSAALGGTLLICAGVVASGANIDGKEIIGSSLLALVGGALLHVVVRRIVPERN